MGGGKTEDGAHLWSQFSRMPKEYLHLPERETLLQLANLENELGGGISLTSFIAGFHLGTGIAGEYCFEDGAERRAARKMKIERIPIKD